MSHLEHIVVRAVCYDYIRSFVEVAEVTASAPEQRQGSVDDFAFVDVQGADVLTEHVIEEPYLAVTARGPEVDAAEPGSVARFSGRATFKV